MGNSFACRVRGQPAGMGFQVHCSLFRVQMNYGGYRRYLVDEFLRPIHFVVLDRDSRVNNSLWISIRKSARGLAKK